MQGLVESFRFPLGKIPTSQITGEQHYQDTILAMDDFVFVSVIENCCLDKERVREAIDVQKQMVVKDEKSRLNPY